MTASRLAAATGGLRETRVLVTGAGGQLGGYLRAALRQAGATVTGTGGRPGDGIDAVADIANADAELPLLLQLKKIESEAVPDLTSCPYPFSTRFGR